MDNPFKAKEGQQTCNSCVYYERCTELNKSTKHLDGCVTCKCYESKGDNIQELDRMKNTLNAMCTHIDGECDCSCTDCIAQGLVALGIGDKKQAVIEFAEKLKYGVEEMGMEASSVHNEAYNEALEDVHSFIDELIKEFCGNEENKN